jgi:hypothetical protein
VPGSPTAGTRNLSVKFADAASGDTERVATYDRLKFEQTAPPDRAILSKPRKSLKPSRRRAEDSAHDEGDDSKYAPSAKFGSTSDWNHWGTSTTNVDSISTAVAEHASLTSPLNDLRGEALRNARLRRSDEKREAAFKAKVDRHEAARKHRDSVDFLGGEGRVNPVVHRGLPTPLLEFGRPVNPEHMDDRDFLRHIRIRERVNNPEKLQELLAERFDYSTAAETLADKVKRKEKATMGRRAGGRY